MERTIKRLVKWFLHAVVDWLEVLLVFAFAILLALTTLLFAISICVIAYSIVLLVTGHFLTGFSLLFVSFFISVMSYQLIPNTWRGGV